jgi:hypothetical protein
MAQQVERICGVLLEDISQYLREESVGKSRNP